VPTASGKGDDLDGLNAIRRAAKELAQNFTESVKASAPTVLDTGQLDAMKRVLSSGLPRMDDVISSSVASGADLRLLEGPTRFYDLPAPALKTGTEYAIERVEREVSRLASIAAAMADNTGSNAQIAKTNLEQSIALVAGLSELSEITRRGQEASNRSGRSLIWLTRVLAVMTIELLMLTVVLVVRALN